MDARCDFLEKTFRAGTPASYDECDVAANAGKIDYCRRLPIDSIVVDVFRNAHHHTPLRGSVDPNALSKGISRLTPIFARHVLRHDCYRTLVEQIVPSKIPPSDQPRTKRSKDTRRNTLDCSVRGHPVN